jgi:hypothetical protein
MSAHHLTVLRDFGAYRRGDHIEDGDEIARILGGEHVHHVVKVHADAKPAGAPADPAPAPVEAPAAPAAPQAGEA